MNRLDRIENLAISGAGTHNNLRVILRGSPQFVDPQMLSGNFRFAYIRGVSFAAMLPNNQSVLATNASVNDIDVTLENHPVWMSLNTLVRIGTNEKIGELSIVKDVSNGTTIHLDHALLADYLVDETQTGPLPVATLLGTPCVIFEEVQLHANKYMVVKSWWPIVPYDVLLMSRTPSVLTSLVGYTVASADFVANVDGNTHIGEPATLYIYTITLATQTGLLPFIPQLNDALYLRAQPLYYTGDFGQGDTLLPNDIGPFLFDAFYGNMIADYSIETKLGLKLWDGFGDQINGTGWQEIPSNYLILERNILAESLLFWQRVEGNFQFHQKGVFQAELSDNGRFTMCSYPLVPKWPTDKERGWVIPIKSPTAVRAVIQFEPQDPFIIDIPADTITYLRPKILAGDVPIDRVLFTLVGGAGLRVQIQDWKYDGAMPTSFSYHILGTGDCYGNNRWLAGGFSLKPLFYTLSSLKAKYSYTNDKYNAGFIYR